MSAMERHYLRREVYEFARLMEDKLREHDEDRGVDGWKECDWGWLLDRLEEEMRELRMVFGKIDLFNDDEYGNPRIASEAADIGNFAMFICDVLGLLDGRNER